MNLANRMVQITIGSVIAIAVLVVGAIFVIGQVTDNAVLGSLTGFVPILLLFPLILLALLVYKVWQSES